MYGVYYCNCGDPTVNATNYSPVHLNIDNRTDAARVARAFKELHPNLLWAAIDDQFVNADFASDNDRDSIKRQLQAGNAIVRDAARARGYNIHSLLDKSEWVGATDSETPVSDTYEASIRVGVNAKNAQEAQHIIDEWLRSVAKRASDDGVSVLAWAFRFD